MPYITLQQQILERSSNTSGMTMGDIVAIGTVVDTNDPIQMGRIRAVVPAWGDSWEHEVEAMPWCLYVTPFGGQVNVGTRGPNLHQTQGGVAYGMWAIPKIGAQVVVMSLDDSHQQRIYMGCIYQESTAHTLPHGRWISDEHPAIDTSNKPKPYGPFSSMEQPIQPLSDNMLKAFGNKSDSHEWRSRAADYSVSRVDVSHLHSTASKVQDDLETKYDDWSSTQGYQNSRIDPNGNPNGKNYDSQVYSWTTPGFHAISMDDRQENCRIRMRTVSGHQILMDDTNERIYIATAEGNNWIELDQAGNIDIYTNNKVSVRAKQDINFTSDKTIRMYAKEGIHMHSDDEMRITTKKDIHVKTDTNFRLRTKENLFVQTSKSADLLIGDKLTLSTKSDLSLKTDGDIKLQSAKTTNVKAGDNILVTTDKKFYVNGLPAAKASRAKKAEEKPAFFTNKVPDAEPYARVMTKKDDSHEPELEYSDPNVGKMERGKKIQRSYYWRR